LVAALQVPAAVELGVMAAYVAAAMVRCTLQQPELTNRCVCLHLVVCRCLLLWCLTPWLHTWQQQMQLQRSMWGLLEATQPSWMTSSLRVAGLPVCTSELLYLCLLNKKLLFPELV
jgi:hypothetical protein